MRDPLGTFMEVAATFATQSTCERGQVGCVIVRDNRIISTGYNGAPPGMLHCTQEGCLLAEISPPPGADVKPYSVITGCQRAIHAEVNAIAWSARAGVRIEGATLYCTHGPCAACARTIIAAGLYRVIYRTPYRLKDGIELLHEAGVLCADEDYVRRYG